MRNNSNWDILQDLIHPPKPKDRLTRGLERNATLVVLCLTAVAMKGLDCKGLVRWGRLLVKWGRDHAGVGTGSVPKLPRRSPNTYSRFYQTC